MLLTRYRSLSTRTRSNRIEPERSQRSKLVGLARLLAGLMLLLLLGSVLFQRSTTSVVPMPHQRSTNSVLLTLDGAVSVKAGDQRALTIASSYLLSGPTITSETPTSETEPPGQWAGSAKCSTRGPCRLSSTVVAAPGDRLELVASDGPVLVRTFEGDLSIALHDQNAGVSIGWLDGPLTVSTVNGAVNAESLSSEHVSIVTNDGPVNATFRSAPKTLSVKAGAAPVAIRLPEGSYNVKVIGAASKTVDVVEAGDAESTIRIETDGDVTVTGN